MIMFSALGLRRIVTPEVLVERHVPVTHAINTAHFFLLRRFRMRAQALSDATHRASIDCAEVRAGLPPAFSS